MSQKTSIEWTDHSSNLLRYRRFSDGKTVWACVKNSSGCAHCYAEALAFRYQKGSAFLQENIKGVEPFIESKEFQDLLHSKKLSGKRVFLNDMTDMFGPWISDDLLHRMFAVMAVRSDVTFQLLTKHAQRMQAYYAGAFEGIMRHKTVLSGDLSDIKWPLPNVWQGVSIEDQPTANRRVPELLKANVAVRFLSVEPMLSDIDIVRFAGFPHGDGYSFHPGKGLNWVICGGESGDGARRFDLSWARSLRNQCKDTCVPFFMKQVGKKPTNGEYVITGWGWKGDDMEKWPEDLRIRQTTPSNQDPKPAVPSTPSQLF